MGTSIFDPEEMVAARATKEIEKRWTGRLASIDVFTETHVRAARGYVHWDD